MIRQQTKKIIQQKNKTENSVLLRLFQLMMPYWQMIIFSGVLLIARAGLELIPPLIQRFIIDSIIADKDLTLLGIMIGACIATYAIQQIVNIGDNYIRHSLGERFIKDLRIRIYTYLQKLSLSFFEKISTGELMSRVTNDLVVLENFVTHGSALTVIDLLRIIGTSIVLFVLDPKLAAIVIVPIPIIIIALRYYNHHIRPVYRRVRGRMGDLNSKLHDNLTGIRVIKSFAREDLERDRFAKESENYYQARVKGIRYWSIFFPVIRFLGLSATAAVLGVGSLMVIRGELSLGTLVAFLTYVVSFYAPLNRLAEVDNIFQHAIAAGERIFELLDEKSDVQNAPDAIKLSPISGAIKMEHVFFQYSSGKKILKDISFTIESGQMLALVGPSGSGKTTIANLICRFYDPSSGQIYEGGTPLPQIELSSLRRQIAVVLQDSFLFNNTIAENLRYGKPEATQSEMETAAKIAYAHDFIEQLSAGYETEVGERGVKLSGGQKQRINLARAILADPRILILDEATSSVDTESEYLIQKALEKLLKGRTSIVIAHRLSTIRKADKILVIDKGRIVEQGEHAELMSSQGLYYELYHKQMALV